MSAPTAEELLSEARTLIGKNVSGKHQKEWVDKYREWLNKKDSLTLQECKDRVARTYEYENWNHFNTHMLRLCEYTSIIEAWEEVEKCYCISNKGG